MSTIAIQLSGVGKMYKLYRRPADKVMDALGVSRFVPSFESRYREFWALRGLELTIGRGERMGLIGRNGSGKSTMLKVISGNVPATEGRVTVHGNVQALMELGTGFHPEFTGRENIRASLAYHGLSARRIGELEEEIIDFTELDEFIDQPVKTYSAGMYARLAFSTATTIEPEILIIDEVLGAGDAYFSGKCVERMKRLTEGSGATVLFVSHDLGSVQQLCERVIWVDRGRILMDDSPLNVTKAYYASILEQEEIRLKARNARLSRRQAGQMAREEHDLGLRELLFRFIIQPEGRPAHSHPIRRLRLTSECGYSSELEPGSPMDNDPSQGTHLLVDRVYQNWTEPTVINGGRVRCFQDVGGKYLHAPFVFAVPQDAYHRGQFRLSVEHAAVPGESVALEVFYDDHYQHVGLLHVHSSFQSEVFDVRLDVGARIPDAEILLSPRVAGAELCLETRNGTQPGHDSGSQVTGNGKNVAYGKFSTDGHLSRRGRDTFSSDWADLIAARTVNADGDDCVVFGLFQSIGIDVTVNVFKSISQCEFTLALYHSTGLVVSSSFWRIPNGLRPGSHTWRVFLDRPNLRQGEYVASVGLLRERPQTTNENVFFYCVWNRTTSIRVDEGIIGHPGLGLVALSVVPSDVGILPQHITSRTVS